MKLYVDFKNHICVEQDGPMGKLYYCPRCRQYWQSNQIIIRECGKTAYNSISEIRELCESFLMHEYPGAPDPDITIEYIKEIIDEYKRNGKVWK